MFILLLKTNSYQNDDSMHKPNYTCGEMRKKHDLEDLPQPSLENLQLNIER